MERSLPLPDLALPLPQVTARAAQSLEAVRLAVATTRYRSGATGALPLMTAAVPSAMAGKTTLVGITQVAEVKPAKSAKSAVFLENVARRLMILASAGEPCQRILEDAIAALQVASGS